MSYLPINKFKSQWNKTIIQNKQRSIYCSIPFYNSTSLKQWISNKSKRGVRLKSYFPRAVFPLWSALSRARAKESTTRISNFVSGFNYSSDFFLEQSQVKRLHATVLFIIPVHFKEWIVFSKGHTTHKQGSVFVSCYLDCMLIRICLCVWVRSLIESVFCCWFWRSGEKTWEASSKQCRVCFKVKLGGVFLMCVTVMEGVSYFCN